MRNLLITSLLLAAVGATAQNPVIRDQYTADPTARVFNGKVYLYPSHDIVAPEGQRQDWFCMEDYHVFSSENLTEWQDHGVIITQNEVPWVMSDSYSMWAPDCVEKGGKYYFYFPANPKGGRGYAVGVAVADKPEGPFVCEQDAIKGVSGIDPCVLVDNDGKAYIYWSGMGIRGAKLKDNMKEIDGEPQPMTMPGMPGGQGAPAGQAGANRPQMMVAGQNMEGLPDGFKEGPYAFRRGDWYYLTFPWVREENGTETLAYSMSKSPLGPWDFKGIIMAEHANGCWTNHHSITEYKGQWYLFYHHNDFSPSMDKRRSTCIDKLFFNADGTIQEVKPTLRGVGIVKADSRVQIDRYSEASEGVTTQLIDTVNVFAGLEAKLPQKGSWLTFNDVDFTGVENGYIVANVMATDNTDFTIREGNAKGQVIARGTITVKSQTARGMRDMSGRWMNVTAPMLYIPKGVVNVCVVSEGAEVHVDWVQFKNRQSYFSAAKAGAATPDADGFIRRWNLLEPIEKPNPSNVVFVDTYLREEFNKEYFKGQFTMLPKDGQKVKAGKQTLAWHAVESDKFNVKLFRFAEAKEKQVYGVLFWVVTVIDCPEDIENVRLAAGSNSASMWWLNGEEALLLSGDRRMVKDDGMSPRLTLKKGRNVLRGAIINGPGMSDFCVRFLDEKGEPVKNINIYHN